MRARGWSLSRSLSLVERVANVLSLWEVEILGPLFRGL